MQISRLFGIVYYLLEKKETTGKELANRFEVSVRTIYRDIETLSTAGIPIYTNQGKGGGIVILDNFILNKSVLSEKDQDEILLALQNLSAAQYPEIETILSRLSSFFKKSDINWIELDFSPWGSDERNKENFNALKMAIISKHIIIFEYFNTSGVKSLRRVEPIKLIFKDKAWYLKAYCYDKRTYRTFKISRMANIEITEDVFEQETLVESAAEATNNQFQKFIDIRLKISPEGAYRIYDDFSEKEITRHEDGSFTVIASMPEGDWLSNYFLSYGPVIEAIDPQSLQDAVMSKIEVMMRNLNRTGGSGK
ncbi:helix-turn-helix transcriptional regulator [Clostridium saccharoperbutylacetonicum]|uniref:helix-turn-helix transcriptional regulator n=1 Tax=Clostridium saccharoperbutylacetonicum TaxID=36745 RepID=UPI0039E93045